MSRLPPSKRWPRAPNAWPCLISTCTTATGPRPCCSTSPTAAFFSIHQFPCYPGTGTRNLGNNCFNYPVPPQTARGEYRHVLASALEHLQTFKPGLVAVSAGFDAYARDPLAQGSLEAEDFYWLGQSLRNLGVPLFSLLEGGYSADLPELILAYLKGVEGK